MMITIKEMRELKWQITKEWINKQNMLFEDSRDMIIMAKEPINMDLSKMPKRQMRPIHINWEMGKSIHT